MALRVARIHDTNLVKQAGAVVAASSTASGFAVRNLLDQLRSKVWRSATGWVFVNGQNYSLDFNRGGVKNAVIAIGTYATGATVATALQAALQTADPTPTWTVTYSTTTFKFTISTAAHNFIILGETGPLLGESILKDLGFATGVGGDTTNALTHTADEVSYQSRHCVDVELLAVQEINSAWVLDHNLLTTGVLKFVTSQFPLIANGLDDAPFSGTEQNLAGNDDVRIGYFGDPGISDQYFRFILDDVQNPVGFGQFGIGYAGQYREMTHGYSDDFEEKGADLSIASLATEGALYGDLRPEARAWQLSWRNLEEADADILRAHRTATPQYKCFGLAFDAGVDNTDFVYGYRDGELPIVTSGTGGRAWSAGLTFREGLP